MNGRCGASESWTYAGNANGRRLWKVSNTSQTYQEWYDQKLKAAGVTSEEN